MGQLLIEIAALLTALAGIVWGLYERNQREQLIQAQAQESGGKYVESLANAAHQLVATYRTEVLDLRTRLVRLEQQLEKFGCATLDCPVRVSLQRKEKP